MGFRQEITVSLITIKLKDSTWAFYIWGASRHFGSAGMKRLRTCNLVRT